ncbi:Transcription factor bHLH123 [Platanthera guangdongensis]|uniref:Transcription factor bHLH123 n=1 Tax=Platanthera guangdongensis TaxID=2320717 RepID=A0ABR2MCB0_9ASPA
MMAFHGVLINETQQPLWKQFGDANYNPLWNNASAGGFYPSPLPPSRTQISESSSGCRKTGMGLGGDWEERASTAPEKKKTRIEAPSAMPANTVMRKENLRDRITALQQLVSPFGKTDTASVLQEAIEYIKFLHDQVSVLCAPYFKTGRPMQQNQNSDNICVKAKAEEERRADILRSRGLCLVPMENIYPADGESITTTSEFWTPIHGRTYW